ncbi:MAG: hypothetical protein WCT04_06275 [Planctomycetota bacterium]
MNDPLSIQRNNEMDVRNRAAAYTQQAQQESEIKQQAITQQHATDFQQMLWIKNLDQTSARDLQAQLQAHEMALRSADHRAAIELEAQKRQTALELKRLEIEASKGLRGTASTASKSAPASFWDSDLLKSIIMVSLPIIIPAVLAAILKTPAPLRRNQFIAGRRKKFPFMAASKRRRKPVRPSNRRRHATWQRSDLRV